LHGYVKRDIERYMFPTIASNLRMRILGVLCERIHGLGGIE